MTGTRHRSPFADMVAGVNAAQHLSVDALVAFTDGELSLGAHERAAAHVARCAACAAEVDAQRQARSRVREAGGPGLPASLLASLCSIPDRVDTPELPDGLGVAADGTLVAVVPGRSPSIGTARLGTGSFAASAPLGSTGLGRSRSGPGPVVSGLVVGAIVQLTAGGGQSAPRPSMPAPSAPPPAVAEGSDLSGADRGATALVSERRSPATKPIVAR